MEIGNYVVLITLFGSLLALCYALIMARRVKKFPEGTEQMKKISASIRAGANAYLKLQYSNVVNFFV